MNAPASPSSPELLSQESCLVYSEGGWVTVRQLLDRPPRPYLADTSILQAKDGTIGLRMGKPSSRVELSVELWSGPAPADPGPWSAIAEREWDSFAGLVFITGPAKFPVYLEPLIKLRSGRYSLRLHTRTDDRPRAGRFLPADEQALLQLWRVAAPTLPRRPPRR